MIELTIILICVWALSGIFFYLKWEKAWFDYYFKKLGAKSAINKRSRTEIGLMINTMICAILGGIIVGFLYYKNRPR